jgi:acetyl esterase/lipase
LIKIPARDGFEMPAKLYQPDSKLVPANGSPVIVMYHEGGWSMGDLTDEDLNCRMFAKELGAVCFNIDYRSVSTPLLSTWY